MSPPPRRRLLRRLLLVPVALVLLELALQVAAPLVQGAMRDRDDGPPAPDAAFTVLCVGDSNTYGLHLPRAYAYPALLEARLAQRLPGPVAVVNRGVPGQSAAQVAEHLPGDLAAVDPDLVIVLAGINDTWNATGRQGALAALVGRSRLVRLARVLASGVTTATSFDVRNEGGRMVVDRGDGGQPVAETVEGTLGTLDGDELQAVVTAQLERMRAACEDHDVPLVIMTYPDPHLAFPTVNASLRAFASGHGLPLVEHDRAFAGHYEALGYETLMFPDHHLNLRGYGLLVDGLVEGLGRAGLVPAAEVAPSHDPAVEPRPGPDAADVPLRTVDVAPSLREDPEAEGVLVLAGPPGWAFQIALSRELFEAPAGLSADAATTIPLHEDEILVRSRREPGLSGTLDARGEARVRLPASLLAERPLRACLVLLREADEAQRAGSGVAAVSRALVLQAPGS